MIGRSDVCIIISIIYESIIILISLTVDAVCFLFHLQLCHKQCYSLCQPFGIPVLIMIVYKFITLSVYHGFNINNYYAHYFRNVLAHKLYYYAYDSNVSYVAGSFLFFPENSVHVLRTCACEINSTWLNYTLIKMASNSRSNLCHH